MAKLPQYVAALIAMARPGFLLGILPVYLSGVTLSRHEGHEIGLHAAGLGILLVWAVQIMTHYNNEYRDVETDTASESSSRIAGGSQVLVSGVVSPTVARVAALVAFALSILLAVITFAVTNVDGGILVLAGAAIAGGWFYSEPPLKLITRGVGEATVALIVGMLVPTTAYYLQMSTVSTALGLLCLSLVPLAFAMSVATALPDQVADKRTGKWTLAVRLGKRQVGWLLVVSVAAGWAALAYTTVSLQSGRSAVLLLLIPTPFLIGAVARFAPTGTGNSAGTAKEGALATVANLGWASLTANAILY